MTSLDAFTLPPLPTVGCDPDGPSCRGQRAKVFILCDEANLTKGERHTIASIVIDRTLDSFASLTHREASMLIDAISGWHAVSHLIDTARPWTIPFRDADMPCGSYEPVPGEFRQPASRADIDTIIGLSLMAGIDLSDVFDLALFVLGVEITNWAELYPSGARRVQTALRGYLAIEDVLSSRL